MKDGKVFGKINIIDMLVIVAIIVSIIGFAVRILSVDKREDVYKERQFEVVVKVDGIRECSVDALKRGGTIFSNAENKPVGEILNVKSENVKYDLIMLDGTRKLIEHPDKFTAYVTLHIDGKELKGKYYDDDDNGFSIGNVYGIFSKYASTSGTVISLKQID